MQAIEDRHQERGDELEAQRDDAFAIEPQLVNATGLFELIDERLGGWRSVTPPVELTVLHDDLVAGLAAVQEEVVGYLAESSMEPEEFNFGSIGRHPEIRRLLGEATNACRALRTETISLGFPADFAYGCQM